MQPSGPPPNAIELSFDVVHEGWSVYKVKDGPSDVELKIKLVLLKVFLERIDEQGNPKYGAGGNVIITVKVPPDLKGAKSNQVYSSQEIQESLVAEDLPFETVKEEWNDYRIEKDISVSVKPIMTVVSRSSKYDGSGDPIYNVQHQEIVKGKTPDETRARLARLFTK